VGVFSRLEGGLDSAFDRAAGAVFRGPVEPAQIAKRAEKQMNREKLVGAGKQYAPTLYTVLVNANDNRKLFGFYPTMAAEIETYLVGKGTQNGLKFDGRPLVRFIVDEGLKSGKFDIIAENVAAPIIAQLREEELEFYGLKERKTPPPTPAGADEVNSGIAGASAVLPPKVAALDDVDTSYADAIRDATPGASDGRRSSRLRHNRLARIPELSPSMPALATPIGPAAPNSAPAPAPVLPAPAEAVSPGNRPLSMPAPLSPPPTFGSPVVAAASTSAAFSSARLTNINAKKSYALAGDSVIFGRDASCDIVIDDVNISRRHAKLTQDVVGTWKLTDLGSTNGTRLNGRPITAALLRDGDQISVGVTVLEFREG
jgi:hypothetical protein